MDSKELTPQAWVDQTLHILKKGLFSGPTSAGSWELSTKLFKNILSHKNVFVFLRPGTVLYLFDPIVYVNMLTCCI